MLALCCTTRHDMISINHLYTLIYTVLCPGNKKLHYNQAIHQLCTDIYYLLHGFRKYILIEYNTTIDKLIELLDIITTRLDNQYNTCFVVLTNTIYDTYFVTYGSSEYSYVIPSINDIVFVDVSSNLTVPVVSHHNVTVDIKNVIVELNQSIQHSIKQHVQQPNPVYVCNVLDSLPIHMSTIAGILLNYPVVYVCNTDNTCLNMLSLQRITIQCTINDITNHHHNKTQVYSSNDCIDMYSYTIPSILYDQCKYIVDKWLDNIKKVVDSNNAAYSEHLTVHQYIESITLPRVTL